MSKYYPIISKSGRHEIVIGVAESEADAVQIVAQHQKKCRMPGDTWEYMIPTVIKPNKPPVTCIARYKIRFVLENGVWVLRRTSEPARIKVGGTLSGYQSKVEQTTPTTLLVTIYTKKAGKDAAYAEATRMVNDWVETNTPKQPAKRRK